MQLTTVFGGRGKANIRFIGRIFTESAQTLPTGILIFAAFALAVLQWKHLGLEGQGASITRLVVDLTRYTLFGIIGVSFYLTVKKIHASWKHSLLIRRITEDAYNLEQEVVAIQKAKLEKTIPNLGVDQFQKQTFQQLDLLMARAATLIGNEIGGECRLALKLIYVSKDDNNAQIPYILTFMRDHTSSYMPKSNPSDLTLYPYTDNTAFVEIIDKGSSYFGSNDLLTLERNRAYQNSNPAWRKTYNSTVVVPVGPDWPNQKSTLLGFLCVDSLSCQVDSPTVRRRLEIYSKVIYNLLSALYHFNSDKQIGWRKSNSKLLPINLPAQISGQERLLQLWESTQHNQTLRRFQLPRPSHHTSFEPSTGKFQLRQTEEVKGMRQSKSERDEKFDIIIRETHDKLSEHLIASANKVRRRTTLSASDMSLIVKYVLQVQDLTKDQIATVEQAMKDDQSVREEIDFLKKNKRFIDRETTYSD